VSSTKKKTRDRENIIMARKSHLTDMTFYDLMLHSNNHYGFIVCMQAFYIAVLCISQEIL
jgi:hypothetical protein